MAKKRKPLSKFLENYYDLIENSDIVEEWRDIQLGDSVLYEVSNLGRVRRKDNEYVINPFHSYRKDKDGKFIYERPTYLRVQLYYYINNKRKKKHEEISRLVAKAFIPIPQEYVDKGYTCDTLQVNHIKGGYEIYNNTVNNLEWCTVQENIDKAFETGLRHSPSGEDHHSTFLTTKDVMFICDCISKGIGVKKTYEMIELENGDVSYKKFKPNFYNIKYKNSWTYISCHYF